MKNETSSMEMLFTNYVEPRTRAPRVWDCHSGKDYPADAIYVGCRTTDRFKGYVIREGTIFGNGTDPLMSHQGALHTESEFRAYAIDKLKNPVFRAEAEKLRGKDLLCWCAQKGKRRAEFCHARVWLELINNAQGELLSAGLSTEQRRDFDWGHYEPNFLSNEEADALFEMAKALPRVRPMIKRSGYELRRCASTTWSVRDRHADDSDLMVPLAEAPPEIISLQRKLSASAGKEVNYFSLQAYENERDHIGFHQHREDKCRDARVFIISLGERRSFGVDKLCPDCLLCDACNQRRCRAGGPKCNSREKCRAAKKHRRMCSIRRSTKTVLLPEHGSLIALSSEANDWYEHAVLNDKEPKGLRISINTKCIPAEDAAEGYVPRELRVGAGFLRRSPGDTCKFCLEPFLIPASQAPDRVGAARPDEMNSHRALFFPRVNTSQVNQEICLSGSPLSRGPRSWLSPGVEIHNEIHHVAV